MSRSAMTFAAASDGTRPIHLMGPDAFETWKAGAAPKARAWAEAAPFRAGAGQVLLIPGEDGTPEAALVGIGPDAQLARHRFALAAARDTLGRGTWRLATDLEPEARDEAALGWLLAGYRFVRYAAAPAPEAMLVAPDGVDTHRLEAIAAGEALTRDLINTPARDMGPADLAAAARELAGTFGASCEITEGQAIADHFPLIEAVGQAAAPDRAPRLIDIRWGDEGPAVTLVGKGVCFDTGGLNLKPGASMGLMKKDMGGAANVLGLAHMLMATGAKLRLRVLIPAVENAVAGDSFRPGDILPSRKGLTVEINNTDAEGRLVLADALALASEEGPDRIVSMATLTGAARVAVGPDLAPFYTGDETLAADLMAAGDKVRDPLWRMPFWEPYETMIEPGIADVDNAPKGGFAGSITAALFLRRFVSNPASYTHFDIYGWNPTAAPGRPKGGAGQGLRALFEVLSPR